MRVWGSLRLMPPVGVQSLAHEHQPNTESRRSSKRSDKGSSPLTMALFHRLPIFMPGEPNDFVGVSSLANMARRSVSRATPFSCVPREPHTSVRADLGDGRMRIPR
ncbi:hypothetical protein G6O67_001210 [Ophiocordyceps sinensis]|uniref:Uncharacterized protein n=1 Tax=Ophiocordyceps sinensis TaxID=72228 RepID=A0A8H4PX78_9HYPO|nr:hypothetical protein G6O67_001210 [Ophiocordyceps sinensis]